MGWSGSHCDLHLASPSLQGKKMIDKKKASRESTALSKDTAGHRDKDCSHNSAPDREPQLDRECRGDPAWNGCLPAEPEGTGNGPGECNLITFLLGLCRSKVWPQSWQGGER